MLVAVENASPEVFRSSGAVKRRNVAHSLGGFVASPIYWALAHWYCVPGLYLQRYCSLLGMELALKRRADVPYYLLYRSLRDSLRSTRYLEFDFVWKRLLHRQTLGFYLDVSSPRLLPLLLLRRRTPDRAIVLNSEPAEVAMTATLIGAAGLSENYNTVCCTPETAPFGPESFDVITSIAGIGRMEEDSRSVATLWQWLKPGGTLLMSLPCAAQAREYRNQRWEGWQSDGDEKCVFQRVYDAEVLDEHILEVLGEPSRAVIYGEVSAGSLRRRRYHERGDPGYPDWREPLLIGKKWRCFPSVGELPGEGVIVLEFTKPRTPSTVYVERPPFGMTA
jgi:SAM-dependent methyltransferase